MKNQTPLVLIGAGVVGTVAALAFTPAPTGDPAKLSSPFWTYTPYTTPRVNPDGSKTLGSAVLSPLGLATHWVPVGLVLAGLVMLIGDKK